MSSDGVNKERRRFLIAATSVVGVVGSGLATVPIIKSWNPSAKAQAIGVPVEVNVGRLDYSQLLKVQWRGQTIGILRRTPQMLEDLNELAASLRDPDSEVSDQPGYAGNVSRSLRPEYLVVNMHCTHLGCVPQMIPQVGPQPFEQNWKGGFYCPCHKSKFDVAGRVYKSVPAPTNLRVPPYSFLDDQTLIIGVNPEGAA